MLMKLIVNSEYYRTLFQNTLSCLLLPLKAVDPWMPSLTTKGVTVHWDKPYQTFIKPRLKTNGANYVRITRSFFLGKIPNQFRDKE